MFTFLYFILILFYQSNVTAGFLVNSMFDFAERFNELGLDDEQMALFSALIVLAAGIHCWSLSDIPCYCVDGLFLAVFLPHCVLWSDGARWAYSVYREWISNVSWTI